MLKMYIKTKIDINSNRMDDNYKTLQVVRIRVGNFQARSQQGSNQKAITCIRNLAKRGEFGAKNKGVGRRPV